MNAKNESTPPPPPPPPAGQRASTASLASSWIECKGHPVGTVYHREITDGYQFVILRGPACICAYIGVPKAHPLAKIDSYDNLPLSVHGGLTYCGMNGIKELEGDWMFWGYDHAHGGDRCFYDSVFRDDNKDTEWTPRAIKDAAWSPLYDFKKLMGLAEIIAARAALTPSATNEAP